MPRKLNQDDVRQKFIDAGFVPASNFNYRNSKQKHRMYDILKAKYVFISLQTLNYNIKKGHRPLWQAPTLEPVQDSEQAPAQLDPLTRFKNRHQLPSELDIEAIFNQYQQLCPRIGRKQNFSLPFEPSLEAQTITMQAIILALNDTTPKLIQQSWKLVLKVITRAGFERYFQVNPTTLADLWAIFGAGLTPDFSVEDSSGNFALDTCDIAQIDFMFKRSKKAGAGAQVSAGFFPYINTQSAIDLERYGIYTKDNLSKCSEPCIMTALRNSGAFTQEELAQLHEMINVRNFPQIYLKNISEHFRVNIYVRNYHQQADAKGKVKTSHVEYKVDQPKAEIKLMILHGHYMLYESTKAKSNYSVIKSMIENKQLRPMTRKELEYAITLASKKLSHDMGFWHASRPIIIPDPKPLRQGLTPAAHGKHFFGYEPEPSEVNLRLNELQTFVNSLQLRHKVDVRKYFKFSNLMSKIMYEFGCFDDVHEIAGTLRDNIRQSLTFPGRAIPESKSIDEKCYYLDFNGAFTSFMSHIPKADGNPNTKIADLINLMYNARMKAKEEGNPKLATTIKFMMNSAYGKSISKPKTIKHKYSANIQGTLSHQGDLVACWSEQSEGAGFCDIIQPYVEHYNHVHFAKVILDGFNNKLNEIKSIVDVKMQNIDAIVVNESDFNKLNALGYIHDTELGKLKIEHVFSSVKFYNKMKWIGVNLDGTEFRHCM